MTVPSYLTVALAYIDQWLAHQNKIDTQTPAHSFALCYKGDVIFNKSYGIADLKTQTPVTNDHLFRVASHSKTFTAVALFQLAEAGKIKITDTIAQHLSFLSENSDPKMQQVTIQQILAHQAGLIRDGADPSYWLLERDYPTADEIIQYFKTEPLTLAPETCFKYSNFGYGLLGLLIERVSGLSYADYIQQHMIEPLKLSHIGADHAEQEPQPYVTGYTSKSPDGRQIAIDMCMPADGLAAATGFYANAENICRFYAALMPGTDLLLSDTSKHMMMTQIQRIPGEATARTYGLGLLVEKIHGQNCYGHVGCMPGCMSKTLFTPDTELTASLLTNSNHAPAAMLQSGIWQIIDFFKTHHEENSPYEKYAGRFYDMWDICDYVPLGDKIYIASPNYWEPFSNCTELTHLSDDTFIISKDVGFGSYQEKVTFIFANDSLRKVNHAGYPKYNEADYNAYLGKLAQR